MRFKEDLLDFRHLCSFDREYFDNFPKFSLFFTALGPNVKFVSPICDLISKRKNRGNFFIRKKTIPGGGGPRGGLAKDHKKYGFFFGPLP